MHLSSPPYPPQIAILTEKKGESVFHLIFPENILPVLICRKL